MNMSGKAIETEMKSCIGIVNHAESAFAFSTGKI